MPSPYRIASLAERAGLPDLALFLHSHTAPVSAALSADGGSVGSLPGIHRGGGATRPRRNPGRDADEEARYLRAASNLARTLGLHDLSDALLALAAVELHPDLEAAPAASGAPQQLPATPDYPVEPAEAVEAEAESFSAAQRLRDNLEAYRVLKIYRDGQNPGPAVMVDRATLRRHSGWGGIELDKIPLETAAELLPYDVVQYLTIARERDKVKADYAKVGKVAPEKVLKQFGVFRGALEGMIAQYFTPLRVCADMNRWLLGIYRGVNGGKNPAKVLEPSGGIGRFLRAWELSGRVERPHWDVIELDDDLAYMARLLYGGREGAFGTATIYNTSLEEFVTEGKGDEYDAVIANPPYAGRGRFGGVDAMGARFGKAHEYFMWRTLQMLAPRGVMIHLTPEGVITSAKMRPFREALLRDGHLAAAVAPPANIFPQAALDLVISVWVKRPNPLSSVLPEDEAVAKGNYFKARDTAPGLLGVKTGTYRGGLRLGEWDSAAIDRQPVRLPPKSITEARVARAVLPTAHQKAAEAARDAVSRVEGYDGTDLIAPAEALGARVIAFRRDLEANPALARDAQRELRADLTDFSRGLGATRPRELRTVDGKPSANLAAFWSVFDEHGQITGIVSQAIPPAATAYQGQRDIGSIVRYIAGKYGYASPEEVRLILGEAAGLAEMALADGIHYLPAGIEPLIDTDVLLRSEEFFTGQLYPRLDWCVAYLEGKVADPFTASPTVKARLRGKIESQRDRLVGALGVVPIGEIDIGLRSMWIHENRQAEESFDAPILSDYFSLLAQEEADALGRSAKPVPPMAVRFEKGWCVVVKPETTEEMVGLSAKIINLLAYINREDTFFDAGSRKRVTRQDNDDSLDDRISQDREEDEKFSGWLKVNRKHAPAVEERYNRAYRGYVARSYDDAALPLARVSEGFRAAIRPHAWPAVRRAYEREGGIMALDVGIGKTLASMLAVAAMRQRGRCRRPVYVVPNTVGPNWIDEFARWMPDWRVVPIGFSLTISKNGVIKSRVDDEATTLSKLHALASGRYDAAVIQHSTFERIRMNDSALREAFENHFGALREQRLADREAVARELKAEALRAQLEAAQASGTEKQVDTLQDQLDRLLVTPWLARLANERVDLVRAARDATGRDKRNAEAALKRHDKAIEKYSKSTGATDRGRQTDQQKLDKWIQERTRPSKYSIEGIYWDDLGVDMLIVDEAHEFKNLYGPTSRYGQKPKYMGAMSDTKVVHKAWDMYAKCTNVRKKRGDTGVLLLTATPLKNSPLETYNLLSLVTARAFETRGIKSPEHFIDRYAKPESEPVLNIYGGFREDLAVRRFTNLDELRVIFATYVDVKVALSPHEYQAEAATGRDMRNVVQIPLPKAVYNTVTVPMNEEQSFIYAYYRAAAQEAAEEGVRALCEKGNKQVQGDQKRMIGMYFYEPDDRSLTWGKMVRHLFAATKQVDGLVDKTVQEMDPELFEQFKKLMHESSVYNAAAKTLIDWDQVVTTSPSDKTVAAVKMLYEAVRKYLLTVEGTLDLKLADDGLGVFGTSRMDPGTLPDWVRQTLSIPSAKRDEDEDEGDGQDESEKEDLFTVMDRMGKAALDVRLLGHEKAARAPKYEALARQIRDMPECAHVIFCDYSETYPYIIDAIVEIANIPRERIESVTAKTHTAGQRQDVSRRVNGDWNGKTGKWNEPPSIDIVIGGKAIEQGINLQKRTCAIHHLTLPWEPATVQQRNGRGVRQGNRQPQIEVFYYISARSFDGYRLSLITGKRQWMRDLLESADRSTNNPGSELGGPCAMIRQLAADEALAEKFCECLENAAKNKAAARQRERAVELFARYAAMVSSLRQGGRDAETEESMRLQAADLRSSLERLPPAVFPFHRLLDQAAAVEVWLDQKTGVPWIAGTAMCVLNNAVFVENIDLKRQIIRYRIEGSWAATVKTTAQISEMQGTTAASQTCDFSAAEDRKRREAARVVRADLKNIHPGLWEAEYLSLLDAIRRSAEQSAYYSPLIWIKTTADAVEARIEKGMGPHRDGYRLARPWDRSDPEAFIRWVRSHPRPVRVVQRPVWSYAYTDQFGRTYPADLLSEG